MCLSATMDVGNTDEECKTSRRSISPKRSGQRKRKILNVYDKLRVQKRLTTRAISRKYRPKSRHQRKLLERCAAVHCEGVGAQFVVPLSSAGAMAPDNTTQYLMNLVYEDFFASERLSAGNLYNENIQHSGYLRKDMQTTIDNDAYDLSLDFQQRDFEEMLFQISGCCAC